MKKIKNSKISFNWLPTFYKKLKSNSDFIVISQVVIFIIAITFFTLFLKNLYSRNKISLKNKEKENKFQRILFSSWDIQAETIQGDLELKLGKDKNKSKVTVIRANTGVEFSTKIDQINSNYDKQKASFSNDSLKIDYQLLDNGIKEEIIINEKPENNKFTSEFKIKNLKAFYKNNIIVFEDKDENYQFHITEPYAYDAAGNVTHNVKYELKEIDVEKVLTEAFEKKEVKIDLLNDKTEINQDRKITYQLVTIVDKNWLNSNDRVYPITIDPTIVHDTDAEFSTGKYSETHWDSTDSVIEMDSFGGAEIDANTIGLWTFDDEDFEEGYTATGGTITTDGDYVIHTFTSSGTFTANENIPNAEVLVVAGGGGGGVDYGGGGGAGGLIHETDFSISSGANTVTIGAGGGPVSNGGNSVFSTLTAIGGGGGRTSGAGKNGYDGGSGGGCGYLSCSGGSGVDGQGYDGGGGGQQNYVGKGGGGAGEIGGTDCRACGGDGLAFSISGTSTYYAGGGGAAGSTGNGDGGLGGGAPGSTYGADGTPNTGGGGGSSAGLNNTPGSGGSGIVIIRYLDKKLLTEDSSSQSNNTIVRGTPIVSNGQVNNAKYFDGIDDYLETDASDYNFTSEDFTIDFWVNPMDLSNTPVIFSKGTYNNDGYYVHLSSTGSITFRTNQASTHQDSSTLSGVITEGEWQHIAFTRSGSSITIYVNGIDVTNIHGTHVDPTLSNNNLVIGTYEDSKDAWYYTGEIDEFRISNSARTAAEIKETYEKALTKYSTYYQSEIIDLNNSSTINAISLDNYTNKSSTVETVKDDTDLIAQWKLNQASGNTAYEAYLNNSLDGTLYGFSDLSSRDAVFGSGWTGKFQKWGVGALVFDGTDDYISVPYDSSLNLTSALTISAWIKTNKTDRSDIVTRFNASNPWPGYGMIKGSNGLIGCWVGDNTSGYVYGTTKVDDDQWHQATCTYSNNTVSVYIDGKIESSGTRTPSLNETSTALRIGDNISSSAPFEGIIDNVTLYSRALDQKEILANYRATNLELQYRYSSDNINWSSWLGGSLDSLLSYGSFEEILDTDAEEKITFTSTDTSDKTNLEVKIATNELGENIEAIFGESDFSISKTDSSTIGFWNFDQNDIYSSYGATGGTISTDGNYKVHTFNSSGTFTIDGDNVEVQYLIIGGGGGGGNSGGGSAAGGGGGGGGFVTGTTTISSNSYSITVGSGGTAGAVSTDSTGGNGGNSSFNSITATGGGGGGARYTNGLAGGSGGGAGSKGPVSGGSGTSGQGYAGGDTTGDASAANPGGGGGGAGAVGGTVGSSGAGGNGGNGLISTITGTATYYAGGGGGGDGNAGGGGTGGLGGGGNGGSGSGTAGTANTGGGGGGAGYAGMAAGAGGSGIVILRYLDQKPYTADSSQSNIDLAVRNNTTINPGQIVNAKYFDGDDDYLETNASNYNFTSENFTIDFWINPTSMANDSIFLGNGRWNTDGYYAVLRNTGRIDFLTNQSGATQNTISSIGVIKENEWQHVAFVRNGTTITIYVDGIDVTSTHASHINPSSTTRNLVIGTYGYNPSSWYYKGHLDEFRISNTARSAEEIKQTYELSQRSHKLTTNFKADLQSSNLISNSSDLIFDISETAYGTSDDIENLFVGDTVILREEVSSVEYMAEGIVSSISSSTGTITVENWGTSSTFPAGGFTTGAEVFKWETKYLNMDNLRSDSLDGLSRILFRQLNGDAKFWLKSVSASNNPSSLTGLNITDVRYFQYRTIFSSEDLFVSPLLSSVTLEYVQGAGTPSFDSNSLIDDIKTNDRTPTVSFSANSPNSEDLDYEVQWSTDSSFTTYSSADSSTDVGFVNTENGGDTAPFTTENVVSYTWQANLSNDNTYFYRVRAKILSDPGDWSEIRALTTDTSLANNANRWYQDKSQQFEGNTNDVGISTSSDLITSIAGTYSSLSPKISASSLHSVADYWKELSFTDTETTGDIKYQIMYDDLSTPIAIPDEVLDGNSTGFDDSAIDLTDIDTTTYPELYVKATLTNTAGTPSLDNWELSLNDIPEIPTLTDLTGFRTTTPTLNLYSTDVDNDYLQFKITLCTDSAMTTNCQTFDQTSSQTGWSGQNANSNTAYNSGSNASYTIQSALQENTTYYWKAITYDPNGSKHWSETQTNPSIFTTTTTPSTPDSLLAEGETNPQEVKDITPEFSAIYRDNDTGDYASYYQIQVSTDSSFTVVNMWDTGKTSMSNLSPDARMSDVSYAGNALAFNGATYYWRIRFWDSADYASPWSSSGDYFTMYTLMAPYNCLLVRDSQTNDITITWADDNPLKDSFTIQKSSNFGTFTNLATGLSGTTTEYLDENVLSSNIYQYRITTYSEGVQSPWCTTDILSIGLGNVYFEGLNMSGLNIN